MVNTLKALCSLSGVSSFEEEVRGYIIERARPCAGELRVDALGNVIVTKKGKKPAPDKLMLCAHMDEVGLIVKGITDEGYIKFGCVGGIDRRVLLGKSVLLGKKKVPGVIGLKAIHLVEEEEFKKVPKLKDLYIDIGARDKESAEQLVELGDCGVFVSDAVEFGSGMLKAKAIDDRVGCAVMLKLLEEELPMDCTFVFTSMEEVGARGAFGAAFSVKPEVALVLEGTTAADNPELEPHRQVCWPGKGPVLSWMDNGTIYDRALFEQLRELAEQNGIPWQMKHYISGGTDAKSIQRSRAGVRVTGVSAAVRYIHAPSSVVNTGDLENILALVRLFIGAMAQQL